MTDLERIKKDVVKMDSRANICWYDTKVLTKAVRLILEELTADRKTEPTGYNLSPVDKDINVRSKDEPQIHGLFREDELSDDDVKELRKQIGQIIEYADRKTENSSEKPNNCEYAENPSGDVWECGCFLDTYCEHQIYDRNPDGTINIVKCGYEPKDEPTTEDCSTVDKDINVRSKDEPKLSEIPNNCDTCKYGEDKHRYAHICNECGVGINNYEPKTEPQTDGYMTAEQTEDYRKMLDKAEHKVYGNIEDEPQTDGILFKGNLKEGEYKLIKTSNGWVLEGNDIAYCGEPQTERSNDAE